MTDPVNAAASTDPVGEGTLELFADTNLFNSWLYGTLARWCKDNLLEIGSGIGNISAYYLRNFKEVSLSDLREHYCDRLKNQFAASGSLKQVLSFDLAEKNMASVHPQFTNSFDCIVASNVVEHIEDDGQAVKNCYQMLRPGGRLVVLVPAYTFLYNIFDKELGHFRRYRRGSMKDLFESGGFNVIHTQYFNAAGTLGWFVSGSVLKKKMIPGGQLKLYNKLVPAFKIVDGLLMNRMGLSVIAVGEKK